MKAKFDVLLVAGMHRSGTSAMARLVGDIGYYLGDNLLSPNSDNPRGFYEDATLMQFNVDFLEKTTGDGYHGNIKSHISTIHNASGHFDNLGVQTYLTENGFLEKPFIFKDPRLCLTFPLWQSLLANMGKSTACLIPFRNPLEVARSLAKRDGFSLDYGLSLWFIYNVFLINSIADTPVCFVDYDDLINDSRAVAKTASTFVCADEFEDLRFVEDYQHKFLSKALRHHSETIDSLQKTCSKLPMVVSLYEDMKGLSKLMFPTGNDIKMVSDKYAHYVFYDNLFVTSSVSYQLFLDCGAGYSEEDSITITQPTSAADVSFSLPQAVSIQNIRLDVGNKPCMFKLDKAEVTYLNGKKGQLEFNGHNAFKEIDRNFIFTTHDPQLLFKCDKLITHVEFALSIPFEQNIEVMFEEIDNERISCRAEINEIRNELVNAQNELINAQNELINAQNELINAQNELVTTQSQLTAVHAESSGIQEQLSVVQLELAQSQDNIATMERDLASAYAESQDVQGQLSVAQHELAQTRNDLAAMHRDLAAAYTEAHNIQSQLAKAQHELVQTRDDLATIKSDLVAAHTESHDMEGRLAVAQAELVNVQNVLVAAQNDVLALRSSLSWAITAPLRLGFEILVHPVRVLSNFNMRRTLFALRYSKAGASLYTALVPEILKKFINTKWAAGICEQPPSHRILQHQRQLTRQQNTQALHQDTIEIGSKPHFAPDPAWYEEKNPQLVPENCPVKLIAFYLPQFHPIPENDEWWGEGFTEWTNVTKAKPLFDGHYQPRLPGAMGFYDLRLPDVLRKQAALAKEFGVHGFCFHYYDFAGKRLLETPLDNLLNNPDIDLPFCLCWANENWTRRWDGMDNEILISQEHSPEDDIRFLNDIQKYFNDPRYIKVDGKPFLIIYKASQFPDMAATICRWRDHAAAKGQGLYLVMAQTFGVTDPSKYGFDAAIEFPPHLDSATYNNAAQKIQGSDNIVLDFSDVEVLCKNKECSFIQYKTVTQNWDNTARRTHSATIFSGISPANFENWLKCILEYTKANTSPSAPFAFVNAWNEWAEGAYLEPDRVYGYAYLNAASRALAHCGQSTSQKKYVPQNALKVLFVLHDCARAGAQIFALTLLRWLKRYTKNEYYLLILEDGGALKGEFESLFPTLYFDNENLSCEMICDFCHGAPDVIYGNTIVSTQVYSKISALNAKYITHIHELQSSFSKYAPVDAIEQMCKYTNHYIAPSQAVSIFLTQNYSISPNIISKVHEFIHHKTNIVSLNKDQLRAQLCIPKDACVILACGSRSVRKGTDIFVRIIEKLVQHVNTPIFACWVGAHIENPPATELECCESGCTQVHFINEVADPSPYFLAADIFVLPSREDPFPLVCLEAADAALPIVCFAEAGGMPEFVGDDAGIVVPHLDEDAFSDALSVLVHDKKLRSVLGSNAKEKLLQGCIDDVGAPQILALMRRIAQKPHPVTVIVPNYNYARYLDQRLNSIASQTYRDFATIFLDDASTDDSLSVFAKWQPRLCAQCIENVKNSGSVMRQWRKGIDLAQSDILWIAEADDDCASDFLEKMLIPFSDVRTVFAYSIPNIIDEKGADVDIDYRTNYLSFASNNRWNESYSVQGSIEVDNAFAVVNCAPNVSACLLRKPFKSEILDFACSFKASGDWALYVSLAHNGNFAYVHDAVAWHRRHENSVIGEDEKRKTAVLLEEANRIHHYVKDHFSISASTLQKMQQFEAYLVSRTDFHYEQSGFCPCCQKNVTFVSEYAWLRDHYRCVECHSLPRDRALHKVLHDKVPMWTSMKILEFAPSNSLIYQKSAEYTPSQYIPDNKDGIDIGGVRNLNIERIALADDSYDIILHEDVFEHIFSPGAAIKELVRVCKPGGHIVFTVAINEEITTLQRASRASDGTVSYVLPKKFHGNPVGDGSSLVIWDYGNDFKSLLHMWCLGLPVSWEIVNNSEINNGIEGEFLHVVHIRKYFADMLRINMDNLLPQNIISNGDFSGESSNTLSVLWSLTQKCNYRCSYCFCKKNSPFMTSQEQLFTTVDKLLEMKRPAYQITLYGGEPTLHSSCLDLLQYISTKKENIQLRLITNGSASLSFFRNMSNYFENKDAFGIVFSVHFQHAKFDRLLKNIEVAAREGFPVGVNVMYYPPLRDKIHQFVDSLLELRKKVAFHVSIPFVYTAEGTVVDKKNLDEDFVEKASKTFCNFPNLNTTASPFYTRIVSDATVVQGSANINLEKSFSNSQFNLTAGASIDYTGFYCCNGLNVYYIEEDGNVYGGVCREAQLLGNIFSDSAADIISGCKIHKCGSNACQSIENIPLPKFTDLSTALAYFEMYKAKLMNNMSNE